jgi:hypothetical protein
MLGKSSTSFNIDDMAVQFPVDVETAMSSILKHVENFLLMLKLPCHR